MDREFEIEAIAEMLDKRARSTEGSPLLSSGYAESARLIRSHIERGPYPSVLVAGVHVNHVLAEPRETWSRRVRYRVGQTWHAISPNQAVTRKKASVCFGCLRDTDIVDCQVSRALGVEDVPIPCDRCGEPMPLTVPK